MNGNGKRKTYTFILRVLVYYNGYTLLLNSEIFHSKWATGYSAGGPGHTDPSIAFL